MSSICGSGFGYVGSPSRPNGVGNGYGTTDGDGIGAAINGFGDGPGDGGGGGFGYSYDVPFVGQYNTEDNTPAGFLIVYLLNQGE